MKIGVFGDSFAAGQGTNESWWRQLENFGHTVESYGQEGTSILYSLNQIEKNYQNFDFLIWCCTRSNRITLPIDEYPGYLNSSTFLDQDDPPEKFHLDSTLKKIDAIKKWFKYIHNEQEAETIGLALVKYMLGKHKNLLIVPCFNDPCFSKFNLFELSSRELSSAFPNLTWQEVQQRFKDTRICHLIKKNNDILAEIVNRKLQHGIFETRYSHFVVDKNTIEKYFLPITNEKN